MQLTERFKLSKIESGDPFLPNDLNNGTGQVEEALRIAHMGAVEEHQKQEALDQRVTALEVHKIVFGTYEGTSKAQIIELGFTPVAVLCSSVKEVGQTQTCLIVTGNYVVGGSDWDPPFTIVEGGFRLGKSNGSTAPFNKGSLIYNYAAFG